ncbi:AraC family transcriptional regulator ligand-binding domain-containing protein [Pseudomonas aeruginosa]|nr:AraC family transcriptional regulator ligand-binding domain-containing protein [Pseudomonas aeruginosa]
MTDQDSRHARRTACSTRHDKNNDHADPWLHLGSGPAEIPAPCRTARPGYRPALAAAGLEADQLNDNRQRLPGEAHERLLGLFLRAFRRSPVRPAFGAFRPARLLGVLGYIAMNCATLGEP